jgi:hypothetical protein
MILQSLQDRQQPSVTPDERDVIVSHGLVAVVDSATRDRWTASVSGLASLRDRVRELSRQALATPGPTAPPELRTMIADLEEITRQKSSLDAMVWNGPTQQYFLPTLAGRNLLADLTTWQRRLEGRTFEDFQTQMSAYRGNLVKTIGRAGQVYHGLFLDEAMREQWETSSDLLFTNVDFRFAAMVLAKQAIDPSLLVAAFQSFHHDTNWGTPYKNDRLVGSAVLASLPGGVDVVRRSFEHLRIQLEYRGILPEDRIFVAASLADLDPGWWDTVLSRIVELRQRRQAMNPLLVSALARSPYALDEALARFDAALTGMATHGYKDGVHIEAAAAILAAAQILRETIVERFAFTMPQVAGLFDPPYAPAAMLAASPLEPAEAIDVFRDCIGTVTRAGFFDLTLEIEELALILSYGVAPLGLEYLGVNLPPGVPVTAARPAAPAAPAVGTSWYVWHNYWVYRPIGRYIATHPVHMHTVAAFG